MPFHRELYPPDWEAIRARILERAHDTCEFCGVPNHALIIRSSVEPFRYLAVDDGIAWMAEHEQEGEWGGPVVRVVLTVMHLNHAPMDCRDDNLRAACQRCHLTYDATHHAKNAAVTRRRNKVKQGQAELFGEL